jgi:peptide/nickel transport system substrate-binding protein
MVGCGDDAPSPRARAAAMDPFCAAAMPAVDAWVAQAPARPRGGGYGVTAVVAGISEMVGGMNPLAIADYNAVMFQQFANLMTLVQYDEDLVPRPWLAESWSFNEEGTELTFRLRQDVYWHDGELTDAGDVAFTFLRATDEDTSFPNAAFWEYYTPGPEGVEVVDDFTVRFRMRPHAEPLDPWRALAILPEHLLGDVPPAELATHPFGSVCPVGNGPFVFASHRPTESWTFQANPAFPEALGGTPGLDRVVYRIVPDATTLLADHLNGSVHVLLGLRADQTRAVADDPDVEVRVLGSRDFTFVGWNTRRPQLSDPRVRRALAMAVDRPAIVDALLGDYGVVAETGIPPFHWAYDPELRGPAYDTVQARELLEAAGWTDRDGDGIRENARGVPLELEVIVNAANQDRRTILELMQAVLAPQGIALTPLALEGGEVGARATDAENRDFDGVILSWTSEFRVEERDLFHSDRRRGPLAFSGLAEPRVDALLDTLQLVQDRAEALALWSEYQERMLELQPFTWLFYANRLAGVSKDLRGVKMDFRGELVNLPAWQLAPGGRS